MAVIFKNHLFLATPRTASNAMFYALRELGAEQVGEHHAIPRTVPANCRLVAAVRNHYDWFVTSWIKATWRTEDSSVKRMSFVDWLEEILLNERSLHTDFTYEGYVTVGANEPALYAPLYEKCDVLLKYELLERQLRELLEDENIRLPRANLTPHKKDYRKYYDRRARQIVEHHYRDELEKLEYDFDNGCVWMARDDSAPLQGGRVFDRRNRPRPPLKDHGEWENLDNNPE